MTTNIDFQKLRALGMPDDEREHKRVLRALWEAVDASRSLADQLTEDYRDEPTANPAYVIRFRNLETALARFDFGRREEA